MNAEQFFKKYPDARRNTNCLKDIACPKCGNRSDFGISFNSFGCFTDEGCDEYGDLDYDSTSYAVCRECEHDGTVKNFTIEGLDELLGARDRLTQ